MTYKVHTIDHIGIVVHDFDGAKAFFEDFGFITRGEQFEESELLDKVVGVKGAKSHIAFMEAPHAQINIELTEFIHPMTPSVVEANHIYTQGIQHICLAVEDVDGIIESVKQKGRELITDVINYQDIYKLCYFRGPDGIIIELAEKL
ncbi:MAG TPA: VOC family protein [Candidatus Saccharimonadia bacterium]|nr:VOC family protein [Candidatus Saccharimonadia bacterium]